MKGQQTDSCHQSSTAEPTLEMAVESEQHIDLLTSQDNTTSDVGLLSMEPDPVMQVSHSCTPLAASDVQMPLPVTLFEVHDIEPLPGKNLCVHY